MSISSFGVSMLKKDKKQSTFLWLAMTFSVAVIFNIFNIIYNSSLMEFQKEHLNILNYIAMGVIAVAIFFTFFASSFFLMNKTKELGIAILSGLSTFKIGEMLLMQSLLIICISIISGLAIGMIISPLFLLGIFKSAGINGSIFEISKDGITLTAFFVFILGCSLTLFNWGYVHRNEIVTLVTAKKKVKINDHRTINIPVAIYIIIYFSAVFVPCIKLKSPDEALGIFVIMLLATIGTQGTIRYYLPDKILKLKRDIYNTDKLKLISLSNLYYSLRTAMPLVVILSIESTLFISLIGSFSQIPSLGLIYISTYMLITILLSGCVVYKIIIECFNRKNTFIQLRLVGYNKKQITKIIAQELLFLFTIIIGIPLFHIILIIMLYLRSEIITFGLSTLVLGSFILINVLSAFISYILYKNIIMKRLY